MITAKQLLQFLEKPKRTMIMKKPNFAKLFTIFGITIFFAIGKAEEK